MRNSLLRIAYRYMEMAAMFMLLAMSNGTDKLETIKKVLEEDEREKRDNN